MNKTGFTLVELLAVIVIVATLAGVGTLAYTSIIKQSADKIYETYEDTMHAEAINVLSWEYDKVSFDNNVAYLYLDDLKIEPFNNPDNPNDKCPTSYVKVTRSRVNKVLSMHYKVCLICSKHNSSGNEDKCRDYEN